MTKVICRMQYDEYHMTLQTIFGQDNIQELNSQYLEETDDEFASLEFECATSPGKRLRKRTTPATTSKSEEQNDDKQPVSKKAIQKGRTANKAKVCNALAENLVDTIKRKEPDLYPDHDMVRKFDSELGQLRRVRKKFEHNLSKIIQTQHCLEEEIVLLRQVREQYASDDSEPKKSMMPAESTISTTPTSGSTISMTPASERTISMTPATERTISMTPESERTISMTPESERTISMTPESGSTMPMTPASELLDRDDVPILLNEVKFHVNVAFVSNNNSPTMSRYVSEIMTSTLTNMYMATHSLTGQNGVKGPNATHVNKLPIDKKYVQDLIEHVMQLPKFRKDDQQHTEKTIRFAIGKRLARASYFSNKGRWKC